jgi:hypothetical protein
MTKIIIIFTSRAPFDKIIYKKANKQPEHGHADELLIRA